MHIVHEQQNPTTSQIQSATNPVDPYLWCLTVFTIRLGQGLGSWNVSVSVSSRTLNVSVSVSSRTKCPTSRSRLGLGPVRLWSRLGLGLKGLVHIPVENSAPAYRARCYQTLIFFWHGSAATLLRCGGIFNDVFIVNFLLSITVKEFWKSVIIWQSYGQEFGVLFFIGPRCTYTSQN